MYTSQLNPRRNAPTPKWIWIPYITLLISICYYIRVFSWGGGATSFKLGQVIWPLCVAVGLFSFMSHLHIRYGAVYFFGLYTLWYLIGLLMSPDPDINLVTEAVYKTLLFALTVLFMNHCAKFGIMDSFPFFLRIAMVVAFVFYIQLVDSLNKTVAKTYNPVFYFLYFLPFVFLEKKPVFRYAEIALILITVVLSHKRTALLTLVLIAVFAFYTQGKDVLRGRKNFIKVILLTLVLIAGAYVIFSEVVARNDVLDWGDRLSTMDDGAGRLERWSQFLWDMEPATPLQLFFGHGIVLPYYHNDLMQVIYNSGIVGTFFYLGMCVHLVILYRKMAKQNYRHTLAFGASLIIFFFDSAVGQVIVVHTWSLQIVTFWGIILGDFYRESQS